MGWFYWKNGIVVLLLTSCGYKQLPIYLEFNGYTKELNSVVDPENTHLHWYEDNHNPIAEARDTKIKNILG